MRGQPRARAKAEREMGGPKYEARRATHDGVEKEKKKKKKN